MKDRYILDSSIWVEMERQNTAVLELVQPLILQNAVCLLDVIVAELLRGTRTRSDYLRLQRAFADFTQFRASWEDVAVLGFEVTRRGFAPPLIDLYIARCAIAHKKHLITQDDHFRQIARVAPFEVVFLQK